MNTKKKNLQNTKKSDSFITFKLTESENTDLLKAENALLLSKLDSLRSHFDKVIIIRSFLNFVTIHMIHLCIILNVFNR